MKRVLLLGDSIRMSYQPVVTQSLKGEAEVCGPEDNGRFAKYTLACLQDWLDLFGAPDIVHWNNGIWDCGQRKESMSPLTTLGEYLLDMRRIYQALADTGATVLLATTTPVRDGAEGRTNAIIAEYNQALLNEFANGEAIIHDLHGFVWPEKEVWIRGDDRLHLSEAGIERVGRKVVDFIRNWL